MKGNFFLIIIAVLISALGGYGFFAANSAEQYVLLLSIGSGICFAVTLIGLLGIKTEAKSGGANIKALSAIFVVLFLISNLIFSFIAIKVAPYIIINGILLLIYAICVYGIVKSGK